jgi:hypothetical protein
MIHFLGYVKVISEVKYHPEEQRAVGGTADGERQ